MTTRSTPTELLKIGAFARLAGTNLRTLRYYEEVGLLQPAKRSTGGFRYYRATDVNRLRMIATLQEQGLSLEEIRGLISTRRNGDGCPRSDFVAGVRGALLAQLELFERRIADLRARQERVRGALSKLDECSTCEVTPCAENNFCEPCSVTDRALPVNLSALF